MAPISHKIPPRWPLITSKSPKMVPTMSSGWHKHGQLLLTSLYLFLCLRGTITKTRFSWRAKDRLAFNCPWPFFRWPEENPNCPLGLSGPSWALYGSLGLFWDSFGVLLPEPSWVLLGALLGSHLLFCGSLGALPHRTLWGLSRSPLGDLKPFLDIPKPSKNTWGGGAKPDRSGNPLKFRLCRGGERHSQAWLTSQGIH